VELEVRIERDALVFDVLDRGPGVRSADRPRVFEPFFRSASAPGTQGTGLGLTIAAGIAEAQGGSVSYAPRLGGGSSFSLRLRVASLDEIS
jgi:signal transduction histidine kinase